MTVEAEKFNNLLFASQIPRKAGSIVAVSVQKPRKANGVSPSLRAGENQCASSVSQAERVNSPFFCLFVLIIP